MQPSQIIPAFDAFLADRGLAFEAVIVGGSALVLLGVVQRTTDDCDVLDPNIPVAVKEAARAFAALQHIDPEWLNSKAHDFVEVPGCTDFRDCVALAPTAEELREAWPFVVQYEGNDESREVYWIPLARRQLERLGKELGYDVVL